MPHEPCPYKDQCSHLASAREGMARLGSRLTEMAQLPAPGSIVPCDTLELAKAIRAADGFREMLADVEAERDTLKARVAELEGILNGIGAIVQRPEGDPTTIAEWVCRTKDRVAELEAERDAFCFDVDALAEIAKGVDPRPTVITRPGQNAEFHVAGLLARLAAIDKAREEEVPKPVWHEKDRYNYTEPEYVYRARVEDWGRSGWDAAAALRVELAQVREERDRANLRASSMEAERDEAKAQAEALNTLDEETQEEFKEVSRLKADLARVTRERDEAREKLNDWQKIVNRIGDLVDYAEARARQDERQRFAPLVEAAREVAEDASRKSSIGPWGEVELDPYCTVMPSLVEALESALHALDQKEKP